MVLHNFFLFCFKPLRLNQFIKTFSRIAYSLVIIIGQGSVEPTPKTIQGYIIMLARDLVITFSVSILLAYVVIYGFIF